jgi:DNA-binding LacI/PurR family transcriptional regulator
MTDVARLAGVSHQTVSRVLNGHPNVSRATRKGVQAAIRELGYRRNGAARALVTGRTHSLGVISFDTTIFGPASMLYGVERAAQPGGYSVVVANVPAGGGSGMFEAVERFLEQAVEGIIVIAPHASDVAALAEVAAEVPLVAVKCGTRARLPSVAVDNVAGAQRATRYLLDLGHPTVHHIAGPSTWLDTEERVEGWRAALAAAGAPEPAMLTGDWSASSGYEAGRRLATLPEVTAVFCANDQTALGLIRALAEQGRRVPDDVSVVGFDDIPEAGFFWPPLTTVRQDFGELGRRAVAMLINRISGQRPAHPTLPVEAELIVRASAAPLNGAGRARR